MGVYVFRNNQVEGPFDELVIQQALANGTMSPGEQVCREGGQEWQTAAQIFQPVPKARSSIRSLWHKVNRLSGAGAVLAALGVVAVLFLVLIFIGAVFAPASPGVTATASSDLSALSKAIEQLEQNQREEDRTLIRIDRERAGLNMNSPHDVSYAFDLASDQMKVEEQQKIDEAELQKLYHLRDTASR